MQPYPKDVTEKTEISVLQQITRLRDLDIQDRNNFPNIFLTGRLVGKIPTSSADIAATDRVNDYSYAVDASYVYLCQDDSGTVVWRRIALEAW